MSAVTRITMASSITAASAAKASNRRTNTAESLVMGIEYRSRRSPDEAKRNPGAASPVFGLADRVFPHFAALHAGYGPELTQFPASSRSFGPTSGARLITVSHATSS